MKAGGNSLKNTHAALHSPQTGVAREARLLIQCYRCCFGGWSFVTILFVFRVFLSPIPHPASPLHFGLPWFYFLEVGCGHRDRADISPPPLPPRFQCRLCSVSQVSQTSWPVEGPGHRDL